MFIGHFGVALAAKRLAPKTSLGTLIFAADFLDLLWPILLLLGVEHVRIAPGIMRMATLEFIDYPISHSLIMALLWSILVGACYYAVRRHGRGAWVVGAAVFSHWILDFVVHRPDLPLWLHGETRFGLGLWNSAAGTVLAEVLCFGAGLWIYTRVTRPVDNIGVYAFWSLMGFILLGWISSIFAGAPPNTTGVAWGTMLLWLLVPWAWWADQHRQLVKTPY
jgi:hypothetical protein